MTHILVDIAAVVFLLVAGFAIVDEWHHQRRVTAAMALLAVCAILAVALAEAAVPR